MKNLLTFISLVLSFNLFARIQYPIPADNDVLLEISKGVKSELNPDSIKLLVWNLHKGKDKGFDQDFKKLAKDKDILLLQEVYLNKFMSEVFLSQSGFGFKTATSFFDPLSLNVRTGVSNASYAEPIEVKYVRTINLEPVINTPKVAMITRYKLSGTDKILTVANIHSINFVSPLIFKIELERIYKELKKYPKPIIFAGDFNTWLGEKIYHFDQLRIELGLKEATFNPDFRMNRNDYYLDHFLYSDDLEVVSSKCEGKYMGSDHKPMEVSLRYIGE